VDTKQQTYLLMLNIRRYDPETKHSWVQEYQIEAGRIQRFVDLFKIINEEKDPTLAWNSSCEHGQCGTCSVKVNGKPLLACELLVQNAVADFKTTTFSIEPLDIAPVVRDLIIDIEKAYERIDAVKPYIIEPKPLNRNNKVHSISPKRLDQYINATRCINCFCCASACISSHRNFLGPNAMLAAIIRMMDPRETNKKDRKKVIYSEQGVYRCHTSRACSFVCP